MAEPVPKKAKCGSPIRITGFRTRDCRFSLPPGDGTDSVHSMDGCITYGYGVTVLETTDPDMAGDGLGFTLGGGTDLVCAAIEHLAKPLVGREVEELMADWGSTFQAIAEHPTLRWLGPHSGVTHLAMASITNACFDLWAKSRKQPLWALLLSLSAEQLVALLDLSYCEDALTREEATEMLLLHQPSRKDREQVLEHGIPGYDTSAGWMDCSEEEITQRSQAAVRAGFKAVKLKVGGLKPGSEERDLKRLRLVKEAVGGEIQIAVDANQPPFIEEPTHPHDVAAHAVLQKAVAPIPLAAGEAIPNRVIFKNFITAGAIGVAQIDPTRLGGVSESIVCAMMAKKYGVRVIPHVGDMGQLSQHLLLVYHVAFGVELEFLEYIPHLRPYFENPANVQGGMYLPPTLPGASTTIVSLEQAQRVMQAGESTKFHEGDSRVGL